MLAFYLPESWIPVVGQYCTTHLKSLWLHEDEHVKVGVGHEGEVTGTPLLLPPPSSLAVVAHDSVHAVAEAETHVKLQGNITSIVRSTLQVDTESGDKY